MKIKGLKPTVKVSITLQVPPSKVDKVSEALVKVAAEFDVYEGGVLKQDKVTFDYSPSKNKE